MNISLNVFGNLVFIIISIPSYRGQLMLTFDVVLTCKRHQMEFRQGSFVFACSMIGGSKVSTDSRTTVVIVSVYIHRN